jgi:hypothetical protein
MLKKVLRGFSDCRLGDQPCALPDDRGSGADQLGGRGHPPALFEPALRLRVGAGRLSPLAAPGRLPLLESEHPLLGGAAGRIPGVPRPDNALASGVALWSLCLL